MRWTRPLLLLAALSLGLVALAAPEPPRPRWPVDNPGFAREGFRPGSKERLLSGVFGPRLKWGGDGRYDHHEGFDLYAFFDPARADGHVTARAILPGVVSEVIDPPDPEKVESGRKVVITHDLAWSDLGAPAEWGRVQSGYLHLSSIALEKGQRVGQGDPVGVVGDTGLTTVVHLHLNVYRAAGRRPVNVNPARLFSPAAFPGLVAKLEAGAVEATLLERDAQAGTALVRLLLPWNAWTLDGIALLVDDDAHRALSFEEVTAARHDRRDTGDVDLFPDLRLFPLRHNGGGALERLNADLPEGWPARRFPLSAGTGPRLGFDLLATRVPAGARRFALQLSGVAGETLRVECRAGGR